MKRYILCILSLVLCAALTAASADVIWEPMDEFFTLHRKECVSTDGLYEAAKDTHLYDQPNGSTTREIPAGKTVALSYIWQNEWGALDWYDGWIRLSDFKRLYDENDFVAEHEGQFTEAYGRLSITEGAPSVTWLDVTEEIRQQLGELPETGAYDINLWSYPGSGMVSTTIGSTFHDWGRTVIDFGPVFRDEDGNLWTYIETYIYGHREGWVCLNDMNNAELPYTGRRYADESAVSALPGQSGGSTGSSSGSLPPIVLPVAAVVLVSLLTAALLVLLRRKDRAAKPIAS